MTDVEILEKTLERLRTTGWQKNSTGTVDGPNCLGGAIELQLA